MSRTLFGQTDQRFDMPELHGSSPKERRFREGAMGVTRPKKLKVASYCRVSTEEELQLNSLENQVIHYTNYIGSNPDWQFAGVFTDKGKSGTGTKGRHGFNKIMQYALDGKIDIIICKSISRFARNVIDTLEAVESLRKKGVRVVFEKEEIDTGDMQSDFILTILALTAQEESRNISENITWANTKRLEMGQPTFVRLMGYTKVKDKPWVIVEDEAATVREAFKEFLAGKTPTQIAKSFIRKGYKKANGRIDWSASAVRDILKNERYKGDIISQKSYTKDFLTHKIAPNEGQRDQYLLKDNHEPIVDEETFDKVQDMILPKGEKRKRGPSKSYPLSRRLVCGSCGGNLQRFYNRGRVFWRCGNHIKSHLLCKMKGVREVNIQEALSKAFKDAYNISREASGKGQIIKLIKTLQGAQNNRENEQNRFRLELERALLKENTAIINLEDTRQVTRERIKIEEKISKSEIWWALFDADDIYRRKAMEKLEEIKNATQPIVELKKNMDDLEFLRAWVTRVKVVSPSLFSITWLNGEET